MDESLEQTENTETAVDMSTDDDSFEIDEEFLVEEISIDGMCGVY
jgi:mycofactocin precursor